MFGLNLGSTRMTGLSSQHYKPHSTDTETTSTKTLKVINMMRSIVILPIVIITAAAYTRGSEVSRPSEENTTETVDHDRTLKKKKKPSNGRSHVDDSEDEEEPVKNSTNDAKKKKRKGHRSRGGGDDDGASNKKLDWLSGEWFLCDETQTRLANNDRILTTSTECSDIFGFNITSLTDDNMNFKLEHLKGFSVSCKTFGIQASGKVECDADGKIEINEVFVGGVSLNPKWKNEITFVGKRLEYKDPESEEFLPLTTFVDGYYTTLKVDATNKQQLYVDWVDTDRRFNATDPIFDVISVRSWKLVKDLTTCDTCSE